MSLMKHSLFLLVFYCVEEASLTVLCLVFIISLNLVNPNHYTTTILYPLQAMLWLWNIFNLKWVDYFLVKEREIIWCRVIQIRQAYTVRTCIHIRLQMCPKWVTMFFITKRLSFNFETKNSTALSISDISIILNTCLSIYQ